MNRCANSGRVGSSVQPPASTATATRSPGTTRLWETRRQGIDDRHRVVRLVGPQVTAGGFQHRSSRPAPLADTCRGAHRPRSSKTGEKMALGSGSADGGRGSVALNLSSLRKAQMVPRWSRVPRCARTPGPRRQLRATSAAVTRILPSLSRRSSSRSWRRRRGNRCRCAGRRRRSIQASTGLMGSVRDRCRKAGSDVTLWRTVAISTGTARCLVRPPTGPTCRGRRREPASARRRESSMPTPRRGSVGRVVLRIRVSHLAIRLVRIHPQTRAH